MEHYYWNDWYTSWGWFLWLGFVILMFSSAGNWGYTYKIHRKYENASRKHSLDILNERYARGEINKEQYHQMKTEISKEITTTETKKSA